MQTSLMNLFVTEQMLENSFQAFTDLIIVLNYEGLILDSRLGSHLPPIFSREISRRELREFSRPGLWKKLELP